MPAITKLNARVSKTVHMTDDDGCVENAVVIGSYGPVVVLESAEGSIYIPHGCLDEVIKQMRWARTCAGEPR